MRKSATAATNGILRVKLNVGERLRLLQTLPAKGPIGTARLVRKLSERLSLTDHEIERFEVKPGTAPNTVAWNDKGNAGREFPFSGFELELVIASLRKRNEAEDIGPDLVPLWDKFCGTEGEPTPASPE